MLLPFLSLALCAAALAYARRKHEDARHLRQKLDAQWQYTNEVAEKLTAERDAAIAERNAVVEGVKYVPMKLHELSALAKTGCSRCHGAGHYGIKGGEIVCDCVQKRMRGNPKYGMSGATPVRLATPDEIAAVRA